MSLPLSLAAINAERRLSPVSAARHIPTLQFMASETVHNIPRSDYSFLKKLAKGDLNSPSSPSSSRPFPPPGRLFLKLSRNDSPRSFRLPNPSSVARHPSSFLNLQSSIVNRKSKISRCPSW